MLKNFLRCTFILAVCFSITRCATTRKDMVSKTDQVTQNLEGLYSGKVPLAWGKKSLLDYPILFISFKHKYIERFYKGERQLLNFMKWEKEIPTSGTSFGLFKKDKTNHLVIYLDNDSKNNTDNTTHTILHEGFHFFVQSDKKKWKQLEGNPNRGTLYPLEAIPRYYRWEMYKSLESYLESPGKEKLRGFSWWFNRWKVNFPDEYKNFTDRIEGSAQYYSNAMMTRLHNLKRTKLRSEFENFKAYFISKTDPKKRFRLDFESYLIGPLASMVLDQLKVSKWKNKVEKGASPLQLLAKKNKPKRQKINNIVQNEFLQVSIKEMQKIDKEGKLDRIISLLANPKTHRVVVDNKNLQFTSFAAKGMFKPSFNFQDTGDLQFIALSSPHKVSGLNIDINYKKGDHWIMLSGSPCLKKGSTTLLLYESKNLNFKNGYVQTQTRPLIHAPVKRIKKNKANWYCVDNSVEFQKAKSLLNEK